MSYFLNCDTLLSDKCELGDYVIEWRQDAIDGDIVFVSGNQGNTDIDIEGYHPLVDEIVQGGTLYPVIRYAYFDSQKYTLEYEEGALHSPDFLDCLSPIVVEVLSCGITNYSGDYDYKLIREVYTGEKSRSIKFDITNSSNYLAWGFNAEIIADGIKIYYCTLANKTGTLLDYLVSGINDIVTNYSPVDYPDNPIIINTGHSARIIKYITDFSGISYTAGDYLRIEIIGNYANPSQNDTKWTLYLKCFDALGEIYDTSDFHTIDSTPAIGWDDVQCYYYITYDTIDQVFKTGGFISSFVYKYFDINIFYGSIYNSLNGGSGYLYWSTYDSSAGETNFGCASLNGSITYTKVSTGIRLDFTDTDDYDKAVEDINHVINDNPYYDEYIAASNKDLAYYGCYRIMGYNSGISCDNPGTNTVWYIHLSTSITYDPIDKETLFFAFPSPAITNNMDIPEDCDFTYDRAQSNIDGMNSTLSLADDTTYTTSVRSDYIIGSLIRIPYTNHDTVEYPSHGIYIPSIMINGLFNAVSYGYCLKGNYYYSYQINDKIEFTNTSSHEARLTNWKLSRSRYFTTNDCADLNTYDVIYEATTTTTTAEVTTTTTTSE